MTPSSSSSLPASHFDQIEEILEMSLPVREKYRLLEILFSRLLSEGTEEAPVVLKGGFAKLDYLTKKFAVPASVARELNETRMALRQSWRADDKELEEELPFMIRAVAKFVATLAGGCPIPENLCAIFPQGEQRCRWKKASCSSLRCLAKTIGDNFIAAMVEETGESIQIDYSCRNKYLSQDSGCDWGYLKIIVHDGAVLNLVHPRFEDGICFPELIVFEPDFLVNVTTIASCFESYAESPYVHLVNKLKPAPNTRHIHLGNLSGKFLDDTVHGRNLSFEESWNEYLHDNALSVTACPDLVAEPDFDQFCQEAKAQKSNIEALIGKDLPSLPNFKDYDTEDILIEPTFFNPTLGLQGRLDFLLQTTMSPRRRSIIIEQKSGKGAFSPNGANVATPIPQEKHLVQLNLYRALLHYGFDEGDSVGDVQQIDYLLLLYSKYSQGLVSVGHHLPQLTQRAMRIRNLLAWCELHYGNDGPSELADLTADKLNKKNCHGNLWDNYVKPELDSILTPIHVASPLERAYYLRLLRFVEKEHQLEKIGRNGREERGFASVWLDSLDVKKTAGNIYDMLRICELGFSDDKKSVVSVRLEFSKSQNADTTNFRKGDIVLLYPYRVGNVPDACKQMAMRATIAEINASDILLALRNGQRNRKVFLQSDDIRWAIEHDLFDSSSSALYKGLHSFLTAPQSRRDLLLAQRQPIVDESLKTLGSYPRFEELAIRAKQARELFLIIGPPGTGKTSCGLQSLLKEELLEPGSNILLLSYTNRAVDEICGKLEENKIDYLRIGSEHSCEPEFRSHLLSFRTSQCARGNDVRKLILGTRVFCGTTSSVNACSDLFSLKCFDLAIVDEASQILEPQLIGLLSASRNGVCAIRRFVLIGDHKQLPAVVQQSPEDSKVEDPLLNRIQLTDCRNSLFERLLTQFKTPGGYDPRYVFMLTRQGRMHPAIADFPNLFFYEGCLSDLGLPHQLEDLPNPVSGNAIRKLFSTHRIAFVEASRPSPKFSDKANEEEAKIIAAIAREYYLLDPKAFSPSSSLGVIVPYRNQSATVRWALDALHIPVLSEITVDTVERFQGSQRDCILYGFTIQYPYQLKFLTDNRFQENGMTIDRKLNVAMTRARRNLILIGNPRLLELDPLFLNLLDYLRERQAVIAVGEL